MLFNSAHFLVFFPLVTLIYFLIPKSWQQVRVIWLLVTSYYFYMCWNAIYALLMLTSTVVTYACARLIDKYRKYAKIWGLLCLIINFGILFFFKYQGFVVDSLNSLFSAFSINLNVSKFDVLLPVGISFYTFQAVGYTIDVFRGSIKAEKNFIVYALFVSFFPQLVAGPIERSGNLLHQLKSEHEFNFERVRGGLWLMLWGFFQKLVLADRLAVVVDVAYASPNTQSSARLILATILLAFQIYCDFASYSNIAIGAGRVLDIKLMKNFNAPYFSTSIAEFWRRWHISLSTWLRDYIYIPLGGNRCGLKRKYVNLLIVFFISGLWHGAAWTFVIWGLMHGVYQIVGAITQKYRDKVWKLIGIDVEGWFVRIVRIMITFVLVDLAWIMFRAASINDAITVFKHIFIPGLVASDTIGFGRSSSWWLVTGGALLILLFVSIWQCKIEQLNRNKNLNLSATECFASYPLVFRWSICMFLLFSILVFGVWDTSGFIYFQF